MRRCLIVLCGLISFGAMASAPDKPKPVSVQTYTVAALGHPSAVQAVGQLLADEQVVIRPEVAGRIVALDFGEGGAVRAGQVLVRLDAPEVKAKVREMEADVRGLDDRFKRAESLFERQFVSEQAVTDARQALEMGHARLDEARARADKAEIRAPFSGNVGFRRVSPGAYVKEGDDIVTLSKVDVLKLEVRVPETRLDLIRRARTASVEVDAWPGVRFPARLLALDPGVDTATRTLLARARVNNDGRLKPGMFARVSVDVAGQAGALRVPEEAIVPKAGKTLVFRVESGIAKAVPVRIGRREPGWVEVTGLREGDVVVRDGQLKLKPGVPIKAAK